MLAQIRKARQSESGFTLIELLMVIVILGILAGIVVFSVSGITDTGEEAACNAEVKTVQVASEAYYAENEDGGAPSFAPNAAALVTAGFLKSEPNAAYVNYNAGDPIPTAGSPCA